MPMGSRDPSSNIAEFKRKKGGRYDKMVHKFGKAKANKVAAAAGFSAARRASSKGYKTKHSKGT